MPRRTSTVCNTPGCPELATTKGRCPAHAIAPFAGSTRNQATRTTAWRKLRIEILERDNYRCHICGGDGADTVDHLLNVAAGGTDHPSNLAAVHDRNPPHCHRAKTSAEGNAARHGHPPPDPLPRGGTRLGTYCNSPSEHCPGTGFLGGA